MGKKIRITESQFKMIVDNKQKTIIENKKIEDAKVAKEKKQISETVAKIQSEFRRYL
jgi:hypothetical protein